MGAEQPWEADGSSSQCGRYPVCTALSRMGRKEMFQEPLMRFLVPLLLRPPDCCGGAVGSEVAELTVSAGTFPGWLR